MKMRSSAVCWYACLLLLRAASALVPVVSRAEWLIEWRSELWYARASCSAEPRRRGERKLLRFCLGAFADANSVRVQMGGNLFTIAAPKGSAQECTVALVALLAISAGFALLLPNVRSHIRPAHARDAQDLILIEDAGAAGQGVRTLPEAQFNTWNGTRQHIFRSFAFYAVLTSRLRGNFGSPTVPLKVAHATGNMFSLLDLWPDGPGAVLPAGERGIILSRETGELLFGRGVNPVGRRLEVGSQVFGVEAIAPRAASRLPGHPDAWVLTSASAFGRSERGFLIGRLSPSFRQAPWGERWSMTALRPDGDTGDFTCVSLDQDLRQPWDLFVFSVLLALLALPATTSLPLGEYRAGPRHPGQEARLRRWSFLVGKTALVLAIVYFASMDVTFASARIGRNQSEYLQIISCFGLCLWAMRWILRDQRQRCPVCLGKLTNPARVGHPSWNFLAWNGTELICAGGHGLLHVPEMPTSWFSTQRWLYLDSSWQVLFPDRQMLSTAYF